MIAATLTTRLAQDGISKRTITAVLAGAPVYNLKWLWALDRRWSALPLLGRLWSARSWMLLCRRAGDSGRDQSGAGGPEGQNPVHRGCRDSGRGGRRYLRHRDRCVSHRDAQAGQARHGLRNEPIWMAHGSVGAAAALAGDSGSYGWTAAYIVGVVFAVPAMLTALIRANRRACRAQRATRSAPKCGQSICWSVRGLLPSSRRLA